jgi:DNA-binding SARP family transcriptional activator
MCDRSRLWSLWFLHNYHPFSPFWKECLVVPVLHIRLFGKFCVSRNERVLQGLDACKEQELFSYLLLNRDRPHSRETLAGLLWGERTTEKSKKYLRQTLWHLQTVLESEQGAAGGGMLMVEHDWIQFNSKAELWLDTAAFEEAFMLVQDSPGRDLNAESVERLQEAVQLYRGDLLEGCYQDWCFYERERLQNMYLSILDKLMSYCEAQRKFELGLIYGSLILRYDRARERTHRQLMNLQYLSGDRTAALRQYERCVAALQEELGVKPDTHTSALYQRIRTGHVELSTVESGVLHASPLPQTEDQNHAVSLSEVLGRLKQIQTILAEIQHRVQKEIKTIEPAMNDPH